MPNPPKFHCVAIVGVGLIGGSIGLALRTRQLAGEVVGVGRRMSSLRAAKRVGAVDRITTNLASGVKNADLVVICTPVDAIARFAAQIDQLRGGDVLITDAGSTKADIVAAAETAWKESSSGRPYRFVGSHPLAGDHNTGPEHARADLLEGRTVVVTPVRRNAKVDLHRVMEFWQALGADVQSMSAARHDQLVSAASHTPHLVAAALASSTPATVLPLVGSGWKDTTRVAAGDPGLWRQIALSNRDNICQDLRRMELAVESIRTALEQGDGRRLEAVLRKAKRNRDAVGS